MKKFLKCSVIALAAIFVMNVGTVNLLASDAVGGQNQITDRSTSVSPTLQFPVNGENYSASATIDAYTSLLQSTVWVWRNSGVNLQNGWFGASSFVYDNSGRLIGSTGMTYNNTPTSGIGVFTPLNLKGVIGQSYYSWGEVRVYNGATQQYVSRNVTSPRAMTSRGADSNINIEKLVDEFQTALNNNDMIRAVGTNGVEGWIFAKDLQSESHSTPENAIIQQARNRNTKTTSFIDVFADDGVTVIGQFPIHSGTGFLIQ